jgi:transcriptional regulator with XRE-family HTH domain
MTITAATRSLILSRLRDPKKPAVSQSLLAEKMGLGKSWVTKLLNGTLKQLSDEQVDRLQEILDIRLLAITETGERIPDVALEIGRRIKDHPELAQILTALASITEPCPMTTRYIETKDMTRIGQEIIRLCFANDDKPGKVAREVLKLLS